GTPEIIRTEVGAGLGFYPSAEPPRAGSSAFGGHRDDTRTIQGDATCPLSVGVLRTTALVFLIHPPTGDFFEIGTTKCGATRKTATNFSPRPGVEHHRAQASTVLG